MQMLLRKTACLGGSGDRHSVHRPGRSVGGAGDQFPRTASRFHVQIPGAHALRLNSRKGKEGSIVSSIICENWLILS